MGGLLSPSTPKVKMPPPPPPPAPMDTPEMTQPDLQVDAAGETMKVKTGSRRKYRKKNVGAGKSGGHSKYKGGGLSGL